MKRFGIVISVALTVFTPLRTLGDSMRDEALHLVLHASSPSTASSAANAASPPRHDFPEVFVGFPAGTDLPEPADAYHGKKNSGVASEVIALPAIDVHASKIKEAAVDLKKHDAAMRAEAKNATPTDLDLLLNNQKYCLPKWFFGGQSAESRAEGAKEQLRIMELERNLIIAIDTAETNDEKRALKQVLVEMRAMVRGPSE